jgi:hypothetical protein
MATVSWHGSTFAAEPIEKLANGNWKMKARAHGPRFSLGTIIEVRPNEVVTMDEAETPPDPKAGLAALETAMAAERDTLPSVASLLADAKTTSDAAAGTLTRDAIAQSHEHQGNTMHLGEKLKLLSTGTADMAKALEDKADALIAKRGDLEKRATDALAAHGDVLAKAEEGVAAIESALRQIGGNGTASADEIAADAAKSAAAAKFDAAKTT